MSSLKRARTNSSDENSANSAKWSRTGSATSSGTKGSNAARVCKPRVLYPHHPQSGVGKDFHALPYPLNTLPKKTWETLNQGGKEGAICSECAKPRTSTPHQRKLFLVAERLSWDTGVTPFSARSLNEIALWAVNAELDIFDPAVEDEDAVLGGKRSREDRSYPFESEQEAAFAMGIIAKAENLTSNSWEVWKAQADTALNRPIDEANRGPGSAAEPLDLTSDGPEDTESTSFSQPLDNKQQADAVYTLLQEWTKTDPVLKDIIEGMGKKTALTRHGAQIFNSKVEAATKTVIWIETTAKSDVAKAAKGESPAVLDRLMAKARNEPDFRALIVSVAKDMATAQTQSLFKMHVTAARRATSDTGPPLQDIAPSSVPTNGKGKAIDRATGEPVPPAVSKKACSFQTLQDLYSLLDKIERTSPMGAEYLEAYAERLQAENCKDCWLSKNVLPELMEDEPQSLAAAASKVLTAGLATLQSPSTAMTTQAQGYVDRYRAQYGQDPPPSIMHQYAPGVLPRPSVAAQNPMLPTATQADRISQAGSKPITYSSQSHVDLVDGRVRDYMPEYKTRHGRIPSRRSFQATYARHTNGTGTQTNVSVSRTGLGGSAARPTTGNAATRRHHASAF